MASIDKINVGGAEYDINPAPSDTKDDTISFTSNDNSSIFNSGNLGGQSAYAWTAVSKIATGEKHSSLLNKVSTMFKNIRTIAKLIGTTDISSIGDGTLSGGISSLKDSLSNLPKILTGRIGISPDLSSGVYNVTFVTPFDKAPIVVANYWTPSVNQSYVTSASVIILDISTTGFSFKFKSDKTVSMSNAVVWVAIAT